MDAKKLDNRPIPLCRKNQSLFSMSVIRKVFRLKSVKFYYPKSCRKIMNLWIWPSLTSVTNGYESPTVHISYYILCKLHFIIKSLRGLVNYIIIKSTPVRSTTGLVMKCMMKYYLYKYELCLISGRTVYKECLNLKTLDFGQMEFKSMALKIFSISLFSNGNVF